MSKPLSKNESRSTPALMDGIPCRCDPHHRQEYAYRYRDLVSQLYPDRRHSMATMNEANFIRFWNGSGTLWSVRRAITPGATTPTLGILKLLSFVGLLLVSMHALVVRAGCDNRVAISNPDRYPFKTIATLRYDADDDGKLNGWATGSLVGPHMVLTCGHCVYDREKGGKKEEPIHVQPAAYRHGDAGEIELPHWYRKVTDTKYKRINGKYPTVSDIDKLTVDYGAIYLVCPFEDITTYMPMAFDLDVSSINMSGYPVKDLPYMSHKGDQWRVSGPVVITWDRTLNYGATSTGGASGAPVWYYDPGAEDERRIIAVNVSHLTSCDGIGTRLVSNNEDLITNTWLRWEPSLSERSEQGCATLDLMPLLWDQLYDRLVKGSLLSSFKLRLILPLKDPSSVPSLRVYQYIENTRYVWEEYYINPRYPATSKRYLRMIEPEDKWLSVKEAQVLLTASSKWANQQKTSGKYRTRVAIGEIKPLPMPKATTEKPSAESSQWVERDFDQSQSRMGKTDKIGQFQTKMIQDTGLGND